MSKLEISHFSRTQNKTILEPAVESFIKNEQWFTAVRRENSALWESLIRVGGASNNPDWGFDNLITYHLSLNHDIYAKSEEYSALQKIIVERIKKEPKFLDIFFSKLDKDCIAIEKLAELLAGYDAKGFSKTQLRDRFEQFCTLSLKILTYIWPPLAPQDWLVEQLRDAVAKKINPISDFKRFEEILLILTSSAEPSMIQAREEALLRFVLDEEKNPRIKADKKELLEKQLYEKYAWVEDSTLRFSYQTRSQFNETLILARSDLDLARRRLQSIEDSRRQLSKDKQKWIAELQLDESLIIYVRYASQLALWRLQRSESIVKAFFVARDFFSEIARRHQLQDLTQLYYYEIIDVLNAKQIDRKRISARKTGFGFIVTPHATYDITQSEATRLRHIVEGTSIQSSAIKGNIACRGKVSGKVRVLKAVADMKKLLQGEVLVTSMTTPEFVPAMKKAIAIITDEGGISCHAAIVSRELGIPCIIGTKHATKLLKDGDVVEVDATTGIIRKL